MICSTCAGQPGPGSRRTRTVTGIDPVTVVGGCLACFTWARKRLRTVAGCCCVENAVIGIAPALAVGATASLLPPKRGGVFLCGPRCRGQNYLVLIQNLTYFTRNSVTHLCNFSLGHRLGPSGYGCLRMRCSEQRRVTVPLCWGGHFVQLKD